MRLVKIPNCSYDQFEKIRDAIYEVIPFAIINEGYSRKLNVAIFNFWDSDYIPELLKQHIVQPPLSRENIELLHEKLKEAIFI